MEIETVPYSGVYNTPSGEKAANTAGQNYVYATAGISALSSLVGASLSIRAYKSQAEAQTNAKIANMDSILSTYEYTAYKTQEESRYIDSLYADKVSESTLDTMKKASMAKAAAAETGTSGGSTDEAIMQRYVDGQFNVAIINNERMTAKRSAFNQAEASRQNAINQFKTLASGGVSNNASALVSGLSGFSTALGGLLTTMPADVRASMFGDTTSGLNGKSSAIQTQ